MSDKKPKMSLGEKFEQKMYNLGYRMGSRLGRRMAGSKPNDHPPQYHVLQRTKEDYVFFGSFPQTVKAENVAICEQIEDSLYRGSDGKIYCKVSKKDVRKYAGKFTFATRQDGPHLSIGRYSNGQASCSYFKVEPIKWRVIHRENGILTLLCDKILFYYQFKEHHVYMYNSGASWNASDIRKVLNDEFLHVAFSDEEQSSIMYSSIETEKKNVGFFGRLYGSQSTDKVYLISKSECESYGLNSADLSKCQSDFNGYYYDFISGSPEAYCSSWMTRTASGAENEGSGVKSTSEPYMVTGCGMIEYPNCNAPGVVPVIRVREEDITVYTTATAEATVTNENNASDSQTPLQNPKVEEDPNITLGGRIGATIMAPILWIVGVFIGAILTGNSTTGNLGGILTVAYMVFSLVMAWTRKHSGLITLLVALNLVVSTVMWFILGS